MDFSGQEGEHIYQAAAVSACLYDYLENSKIKTKIDQGGGMLDNWKMSGRRASVNRVPEK